MLSIILPTIRLERLPAFVESLNASYHGEYELICVSPYDRPPGMGMLTQNLQWIIDKGNSVRCQQLGLCQANGNYVHRAVDDSLYDPNALDNAMKLVNPDSILITKHTEGNDKIDREHHCFQDMIDDKFFYTGYHKQTIRRYVPADAKIINFGIYPKNLIKTLGGWDSVSFESIALAEVDLSIRINFAGIPINMTPGCVLRCGWTPGTEGDHAPMHYAFPIDLEKYNKIYDDINCWKRIKIPINNWEQSPSIWKRRFNV